jgi:iron(III) transport system ATP-binding protein
VPPGEGVTGRIVGRRFFGATALLSVAVAGFAVPLSLPVAATDGREPGTAVHLAADPAEAFLFEDERD